MANDLNKVMLIGRLTRDPEFKNVGGSTVSNFSLATNRTYSQNGETKKETHYFDCVVWGKLAEILRQYAQKGKQIAVDGRLTQQTWDSPDGKKQSKVRIHVESFQLLGGARDGQSPDGGGYSSGSKPSMGDYGNDPVDMPYDTIPDEEPF